MAWLILLGAIASEVVATLALRGTADGIRPLTLLVVAAGYLTSFSLMAVALRTLNVGIVYAIWSGVGTSGVAVTAVFLYDEHLNLTAIGGMALVVAGVVLIAASGTTSHG
jgi:small multidrug resistance pump